MSKFLVNSTKTGTTVLLEYNDQGYLLKYDLEPKQWDDNHFEFFFARFPKTQDLLQVWIDAKFPGIVIKKIEQDLSFEAFYNTYDHKVSKKATAEKIWNKMSDTEKAKAINYIQRYDQRLRQTNINKKYPETYLNAQEWNN